MAQTSTRCLGGKATRSQRLDERRTRRMSQGGSPWNERQRVKGVERSVGKDCFARAKEPLDRFPSLTLLAAGILPLADASGHRNFGWPRHRHDVWVAEPPDCSIQCSDSGQRSEPRSIKVLSVPAAPAHRTWSSCNSVARSVSEGKSASFSPENARLCHLSIDMTQID